MLDNPALSYSHGAGPIAIKTLIDDKVEVVISNELGVGASELLWQHSVLYVQAKPGTNVGTTVKEVLHTLNKESVAD